MANLTKTSWPLGWTPSQSNNGNPDGLLLMDNLRQDKNGALVLALGRSKLNSSAFSDYVDNIFSKTINNKEYLWTSLNKETKSVLRTSDDFVSSTEIIGITGQKTCFGDALGSVLICSGNSKKKDNGTVVNNLGLSKPTVEPQIAVAGPQSNGLWQHGSWEAEEYDSSVVGDPKPSVDPDPFWGGLSAEIAPNPTTLRAILRFNFTGGSYDTTIADEFVVPPWITTNTAKYSSDDDSLRVLVQMQDSYAFSKLRIEFVCTGGSDYYWMDLDVQTEAFKVGQDQQTVLLLRRGDFKRVGNDNGLSWKTIEYIRFAATGINYKRILIGEQSFIGGAGFELDGNYKYVYHYVNDNGQYIAKGGVSPASVDSGIVKHGKIQVYVPDISPIDPQVTHAWVYRRSVEGSGGLDQYYRVGILPLTGSSFTFLLDGISDTDVIETNITLNPFLVSIQEITEPIICILGLYNERVLYLTDKYLYLSDRLNPDAYDSRFIVKAFGDPTEQNQWIWQVTNNQLVLSSSKDNYELSGTLLDLPDGTIDLAVRRIGEKYPSLSEDFAYTDGVIFYTAADGLRTTGGSNSVNVSAQLRLSFQGETCHGMSPVAVEANNVNNYPIAVSQGKIFWSLPLKDGSRKLIIYDTILKTFRPQTTGPNILFSTPSGRILAGYGPNDNYIRVLESGSTVDGGGQTIDLLTVFDHNQQPRNRKDTFTLKLNVNTGGSNVRCYLAKDGEPYSLIKTFSTTAQDTIYVDISSYTLGFRYSIQLVADSLTTFELFEISLEYEPRPEQVNYLRIPNSNLGTQARKRFTSFAFVIDTLGSDVTFTPYVDNSATSPTTVNKAVKLTHKHYFLSETLGTDIGGVLVSPSGSPFEFYGLNNEEIISEKLPVAVKYLVIPSNDYGSPNRKRHTSYKYQINTRGFDVMFTPRIDGTSYATSTVNTSEKRTVEHFFDTSLDIVGIDIGGILETLSNQEFEFYGVIVPQDLELLPARLKSFYIPYNNFGIASKKRLRTLPLIIDTRGSNVTFTPIVDGVALAGTVLSSVRKTTLFHYFETDVFGTDFGGTLIGDEPFEFYSFGNPENVEILPVGKKYDQFQPMRFDKIGKLFEIRVRLIATGSTVSIPFSIYGDENVTVDSYGTALYEGSIPVVPGIDNTYTIQLPKNVNSSIFRLALGPAADPFHRYDMTIRVATSGMESDSRWLPVR